MAPRGWRLTWILALGLLAMSAGLLLIYGSGEEGVRVWTRATARTSALLFLTTFLARPLHQLLRADATRWMMKSRRYVGVSAAFSHLLHLAAVLWLVFGWPESSPVDPITLVFGGLGFAVFFAMGLTSSDRAVRALGAGWKRLHKFGAWYLWFIFTQSYLGTSHPLGFALLAALAAAALLRAMVARKQRAQAVA